MIKKIIVGLTILAISSLSSVASLSSTTKTRALRRRANEIEDSFNNNRFAAANTEIEGKVFATKGGNVAISNAAIAGNRNEIDFEQD